MTYKTHREFSISVGFLVAIILYNLQMTSINYYLMLPIILSISKYGALFPDVDHDWDKVKEKTILNFVINKIIHITGGKHRSWQTHSIDIVVVFTVVFSYIPWLLFSKGIIDVVNREVLSLLVFSFFGGWISHIISDMLTPEGVRLFFWNQNIKIKFVPRKFLFISFKTGNGWEQLCYKIFRVLNILLGCIAIVYPYLDITV